MHAMRLVLSACAVIGLVVAISPVAGPVAHAAPQGPIDLGVRGHATAINDRDQVVGVDLDTGQSFLWDAGVLTALEPGDGGSTPLDINGAGTVVGHSGDQTWPLTRQAVMWTDHQMVNLGTLGGAWSEATAINNRGQVVGTSETADGVRRAFLWERGRMVALDVAGATQTAAGDINQRGEIAGTAWFEGPVHSRAVVWTPRGTRVLSYSSPFEELATGGRAINERGDVLAQAFLGGVVWHRNGSVSALPHGIGFAVHPIDLNATGLVVADESDETIGSIGYVWHPGKAESRIDLPGHTDAPFYPTTRAGAINNRGTIAGSAWAVDPADDAHSEQRAVLWRGAQRG